MKNPLLLLITTVGIAQADVLSLNFVRGSSGEIALAPADVAGAFPAANWNNTPPANAYTNANFPLINDSGAATTATADWLSGGASWSIAYTGTGNAADIAMMTGYLDQGGNGAGQIHTVTIKNIPYANYDVYLYHSSSGGANRTARYRANGYDLYTRNLAPAGVFNSFVKTQYVTLADAVSSLSGSNYVVWDRMSGATLSIEAQGLGDADGGSGGNTVRAPIQGIQIVEITVPADLPKIETLASTDVGIDTATANGNLISNGAGADPAALTVYWGLTDGGSDTLAWENSIAAGTADKPGTFGAAISGLESSTLYYYRVFATNSVDSDWATSATTIKTLPQPIDAISLNFVRGSNGATALAADEAAGVVRAINWNNAPQANADSNTGFALFDANGIASGATADWLSGGASWSVAVTGTGSIANKKLMTGYLDQSSDGLNQIHTVTFSNIPYPLYDVYLYHSSTGGPNRSARYRANTIDLFSRNLDPADTFFGFTPDQHSTLEDSNNSATGGNYVVWQGLSGQLSIEAQAIGASDGGYPGSGDVRRAPVQGIQIVKAEPPVSFKITAISYVQGNNTVTVTWESVETVPYEIEFSTDMTDAGTGQWTVLDTKVGDPGATTSYEHMPASGVTRLFYRIRRP